MCRHIPSRRSWFSRRVRRRRRVLRDLWLSHHSNHQARPGKPLIPVYRFLCPKNKASPTTANRDRRGHGAGGRIYPDTRGHDAIRALGHGRAVQCVKLRLLRRIRILGRSLELKPLLHTWSLGVEEQFYLFWPALIMLLLTLRKRVPFGVSLTLITLAGAALCIGYSTVDPSAAFYLLPFRVFQFSLGALIIPLSSVQVHTAFARSRWLPGVSFWLGLSCIGASVGSFDEATRFPGWAVLLPTTGAALMLLAGTARTGVLRIPRALLENSMSLWLGRVSYSMYLVHWPLIVLYRYYHGLELHIADQFALAASILVASCALHYGIERRFYRRSKNSDKDVAAISNNQFALRTVGVSVFLAVITANACRMSQTATAPVPPSN
ncbi:MAG: acyltransferase [Halieaceae bacterium]|nr:acyltransferase [Halieaceae bacterium]